MLAELSNEEVAISVDDRGEVGNFGGFSVQGLHVVTMQPGAARGNHTHHRNEIICVVGGAETCEIVGQNLLTGNTERVVVEGNLRGFRIKAGIKHTIKNTGSKPFYLVCFYEAASKSSAS